MPDTANIHGLSDLEKFFEQFPLKFQKNFLRSGLRAGANVVLPVARANIHSVSGELAASLKVSTRGSPVVKASLYTKVFYAKFVENGTRPHTITARDRASLSFGGLFFQSVHHPGIVNPHPFMRPAVDGNLQAIGIAVGEQIKRRFEKAGIDTADVLIEGDEP